MFSIKIKLCDFIASYFKILTSKLYLCSLFLFEMLQKEVQLAVEKGEMLPLMEEFYTIQGEGYHTGTAAYFIRIGGCDVGCHWCDVKESWNAELHPPTNTDIIVANAKKYADIAYFLQAEPGQAYKEISLEDIGKFAERRDIVKEIYQNKLTRALIEQAKCDLKFLRNTAKDELVHLARLQSNTHA